MVVPAHTNNLVVDEIRRFVDVGWPAKQTPHLKIAELYRKLKKERACDCDDVVVAKEFSTLFRKSSTWSLSYAILAQVTPNIEKKIGVEGGLLRAPLGDIVEMLKSDKRDWFLERVTEQADFRKLLSEFFRMLYGYGKDQNITSRLRAIAIAERRMIVGGNSQTSLPRLAPLPTSMLAISTLETEEERLEATRRHFTLTSYKPRLRQTDLPPVEQPRAWDPQKVHRIEKGIRLKED